ncbi:MAG: bifunctional metallophosphatase/5'-nucleotidase [Gemmatirosa sp.]
MLVLLAALGCRPSAAGPLAASAGAPTVADAATATQPARGPAPSGFAAAGTFTVLHTNDIHGHLTEFPVAPGNATAQTGDPGRRFQQYERAGIIGGFPRLATAVREARTRRGATNVLLVDAGDTFGDQLHANLERGEPTVRMMDALGYQLMALGNHDFEYTAENTRRLQGLVRFPMRAANVLLRASPPASGAAGSTAARQPFLGEPTLVVTVGGVRVGLLALGYHNTDQTGNKDNTRELQFTSGIEAARRHVPPLRQRADVVVVVSHQGTVVDSVLGAQVPGIDLIIGGHSHDEIAPPRRVGGAWIAQALSDASALGELTVTVRDGRIADVRGEVHHLYADRYSPDPEFVARLDSLRRPHRATLEEVIATASTDIGRRYKSESPVDKLAGEILREYAGADVAMLPGLGFGVTIRPGPLSREMLYAIFPHPSRVVRVTLTGAQILATLEQSATNLRPGDEMDRVGGLLQTSGIRWTLDLGKPAGARVSAVSVGDVPLEPARRYRVVTNAGILQGTHRYAMVATGADVVRDARTVTEVLIDAFRRRRVVGAPALGDITLIPASARRSDAR